MKFEAKTLENVYQKVSEFYEKSISELEINIIQAPSKGVFGFFAKNAIIEVKDEEIKNEVSEKISKEETPQKETASKKTIPEKKDIKVKTDKASITKETLNIDEVKSLAQKEINELFDLSCFDVEEIKVKIYDDETLLFEVNGEDSALLIGKEGYRYNALASMIFTWISQKYGFKTRLEIASFLENQEEMMRKFLEPIIREIEQKGRCKTKSFDGVLVYIALRILREEFPHKYVAIKTNRDDTKYIIVNDFLKKND